MSSVAGLIAQSAVVTRAKPKSVSTQSTKSMSISQGVVCLLYDDDDDDGAASSPSNCPHIIRGVCSSLDRQ